MASCQLNVADPSSARNFGMVEFGRGLGPTSQNESACRTTYGGGLEGIVTVLSFPATA